MVVLMVMSTLRSCTAAPERVSPAMSMGPGVASLLTGSRDHLDSQSWNHPACPCGVHSKVVFDNALYSAGATVTIQADPDVQAAGVSVEQAEGERGKRCSGG